MCFAIFVMAFVLNSLTMASRGKYRRGRRGSFQISNQNNRDSEYLQFIPYYVNAISRLI